ncbi:hypothetical protein ACFVAJ_11210 [Agromyces sp. NPDC057679]|uniref:hypothetical protein n=1 Tax=Agromyces sp. NPDC057679 TaxID=3346207 RepID=UPI00366B71AA
MAWSNTPGANTYPPKEAGTERPIVEGECRRPVADQSTMTMTFTPNSPNPDEYDPNCNHGNVRTEVDTFGQPIGYDVCLNCGMRQYYRYERADRPRK